MDIKGQGGFGETAKAHLRRISARCQKIGDAPLGGVARDDLGIGIRMAVFDRRIVILYRVEGDAVWITHFQSGDRDDQALLPQSAAVAPDDEA